MEKNGIKKALYKQKPIAKLLKMGKSFHYDTIVKIDEKPVVIKFEVPMSDMGDATFGEEIKGQLLIRWIVW
jgi:hypothetical protein